MYRGWGVSLRFATETRTSAHDAVDDAYTVWKEGKEGKGEIGSGEKGAPDRRGRESGKGVIKSKVLSQQGSRHFAVACSAREMTSAKMADLRGAAVLHRCQACIRTAFHASVLLRGSHRVFANYLKTGWGDKRAVIRPQLFCTRLELWCSWCLALDRITRNGVKSTVDYQRYGFSAI
ncbi:hypothetical protein ALC62_03498 [Cyphomyrmex costatus]|uniref:Uncharacterized protein n=1 Tax=Cyphomyrmex costatus TaxID=456900 RepID=A0A151ILF1_9HYME|nr:hypothetical protein ALC62_03498 [Cyphomyrmex costatus]